MLFFILFYFYYFFVVVVFLNKRQSKQLHVIRVFGQLIYFNWRTIGKFLGYSDIPSEEVQKLSSQPHSLNLHINIMHAYMKLIIFKRQTAKFLVLRHRSCVLLGNIFFFIKHFFKIPVSLRH